jgi:hypothetical protein
MVAASLLKNTLWNFTAMSKKSKKQKQGKLNADALLDILHKIC